MAFAVLRGIDLLPVAAAGVAGAMIAVYRGVIESQGDESPLWWVQAVLLVGALLALAGAPTANPRRVPVLVAATGLLGVLGLLAILSIGFPILLAAGLTFFAALRGSTAPAKTPAARSR
jgi:hypothetical protein